ncbi:hypothetical protein [Paenibacillus sp. CF384]|uniref:hypothetical protein n=1 Tax=Paenibacillus sp. CF384 TaxID=1884382 RepID=UPI0008959A6C|nr:hypothetical protein [Paenibacillus sp. CF384]SDX78817.1 hypothetical protein SAMN05518855_102196 [Paenibacillus sp. CF384]
MTDHQAVQVHPFYKHAEEAFKLLPEATESLAKLRSAFEASGEEFLAIELKHMQARLEELRVLFADGPTG